MGDMDEMENQPGADAAAETPVEGAGTETTSSVAAPPKKSNPVTTVIALVFALGAVGFALYSVPDGKLAGINVPFAKDYEPLSVDANSMRGKPAADFIAKHGQPVDKVTGDEFPKKYPLFEYFPQPDTAEDHVLVYKSKQFTVFVYVGWKQEITHAKKAEHKPDAVDDTEISM